MRGMETDEKEAPWFCWELDRFGREIVAAKEGCCHFENFLLTVALLCLLSRQSSQKGFRLKRTLAKAQRTNRPLPHWIRLRTDNTIKWNAKRRHWRRTKLGL